MEANYAKEAQPPPQIQLTTNARAEGAHSDQAPEHSSSATVPQGGDVTGICEVDQLGPDRPMRARSQRRCIQQGVSGSFKHKRTRAFQELGPTPHFLNLHRPVAGGVHGSTSPKASLESTQGCHLHRPPPLPADTHLILASMPFKRQSLLDAVEQGVLPH